MDRARISGRQRNILVGDWVGGYER
jgi:hypothetical protein